MSTAAPTSKPHILFVTPVTPELHVGGGGTATRSFIELLRSPEIGAQVEVFALRTEAATLPHKARQLVALLRSAFSSLPSKSLFEATPRARDRLRKHLAAHSYDLVLINGGDLFFLAGDFRPEQRVAGFALNVEAELYAQQTGSLRALPGIGGFFERDLDKLRRYETAGLLRLAGVVCLSTEDAAAFRALAAGLPILALPTCFSYPPYVRKSGRAVRRPLRLGLLAKYGWWPNAEGTRWLIERVLPGLPEGCVELHLYGPGSRLYQGSHSAVTAHGWVDDLAQVWGDSDIMVCPIVSGSGINVKLVEALYNGLPVLATTHATRGLPPLDDPAIIRRDTPEEWIRFLSSGGAEELAATTPAPSVSRAFSVQTAAPTLAKFLRDLHDSGAPASPRITVVTVTYNAARTLQSAIDSVAVQDYPNLEHVIIDGGSTDGTVEIIRSNAARLAYWTTEPDGGIFDAMNKGVVHASGDWVLFLNADDALYDAHTVSRAFRPPACWHGKKVVYGHSLMRSGRRNRLRRAKPLRTIRFKMPFSHQGAFIATSLLRERPFDTRYRIAGDHDFFRDAYRAYGEAAFSRHDACVNYFELGGLSFQHLRQRHAEVLQIIHRYERGWRKRYYALVYAVRCMIPERLRARFFGHGIRERP